MSDTGQGQGTTPAPTTPPAAAATTTPASAPVTIQDFQKIAFRVGVIRAAALHPNADRLLVLTVDIGEPAPRQIVAGIRATYQPEQVVGKTVVVVANLQPAMLRGVESQGMVLAATDATGLVLISPERAATPGSPVK
jgi:methionyl-tRNA synthetase